MDPAIKEIVSHGLLGALLLLSMWVNKYLYTQLANANEARLLDAKQNRIDALELQKTTLNALTTFDTATKAILQRRGGGQ